MFDQRLLTILRCPENQMRLEAATADHLSKINQAISRGAVVNKGGKAVEEPLRAALVREDGKLLYPIVDDIPVMLVDEALELDSIP